MGRPGPHAPDVVGARPRAPRRAALADPPGPAMAVAGVMVAHAHVVAVARTVHGAAGRGAPGHRLYVNATHVNAHTVHVGSYKALPLLPVPRA